MSYLRKAAFIPGLLAGLFSASLVAGEAAASDLPENYRQLSPRIRCSGEPGGEGAFAALARQGVKTIVSVDGAIPDTKAAALQGIGYFHVPIGYDGVPARAVAALDEILRTDDGPILIHCHHGKHRGPAVAVIACMIEGTMTKDEALATLESVGTDPDYAGLWRDVRNYQGVPRDVTGLALKSTADVPPLVSAMVAIDRAVDALAALPKGMQSGNDTMRTRSLAKEHARLLAEGFKEAGRHIPDSEPNHDELREWLQKTAQVSADIFEAAKKGELQIVGGSLAELKKDCRACHRRYRD